MVEFVQSVTGVMKYYSYCKKWQKNHHKIWYCDKKLIKNSEKFHKIQLKHRDFIARVFLWILGNFSEQLFHRTFFDGKIVKLK